MRNNKGQFIRGSIPHNKMPIEYKKCIQCDNEFIINREFSSKKFCCHECSVDNKRGVPLSEEHKLKVKLNHARHWVGRKLTKEQIEKLTYHSKGNKYAYKNGTTPELRRVRNSWEMLEWKKKIYAKCGFSCSICFCKNKKLNAHHIKEFSKYPELRFDVNNGVALCYECHRAVHSNRVLLLTGISYG